MPACCCRWTSPRAEPATSSGSWSVSATERDGGPAGSAADVRARGGRGALLSHRIFARKRSGRAGLEAVHMDEFPTSPVVIAIVVAAVGWGIVIYNRLVAPRQRSREGWSGIDVQLRRRADLIPNLVSTVKEIGRAHVCTPVTNAQLV